MLRALVFVFVVLWFSSVAGAGTKEQALEALRTKGPVRFGQVTDHLYRGGAPSAEQLSWLRDVGVDTVVDLREGNEDEEERAIAQLGMRFLRFPFYGTFGAKPQLLFDVVDALHTNGTVYVHCNVGRDRTGLVVALYRVLVDHWKPEDAWQREAYGYGYKPTLWYRAAQTSFWKAVAAGPMR